MAIIVMGYILRKKNFFGEEAFGVLSKITLKITLPAAIVSSFAGKTIDFSMLFLALLGLGGGAIYITIAYLLNKKRGKEQQAFDIVNMSGYNIGNFTMPFVQSFLGPVGVIATSLFDTGNACICLGTSYSIASVVKEGSKFSVMKILRNLVKSVPLLCYIFMMCLSLLHVSLPGPVISLAEIISGANAYLAMFMIGVGFKLEANRSQIGQIGKILVLRYALAQLLPACSTLFFHLIWLFDRHW